jgi:ribosomal protein S27AE
MRFDCSLHFDTQQTLSRRGCAMFVDRIKSPRCPKCGAMMFLRIIGSEGPGFDFRTFECPKCCDSETLVASICPEVDVSIGFA